MTTAFPDAVEQLEAYFAGDRTDIRPRPGPRRHGVSATGMGGAADDSVRRDAILR